MKIEIEGAKLRYPNFAGEKKRFNASGDRNFGLYIDEELAKRLSADGWGGIKQNGKDPKTDEYVTTADLDMELEEPRYFISKIRVNYEGKFPPRIFRCTSDSMKPLNEETCGILDSDRIIDVDVVINGSKWEMNGNSGIAAYLDSIWAHVEESRFDKKHKDLNVVGDAPTEPFDEEQVPF